MAAEGLDVGEWFDTFMRLQYFNGQLYGLPSWGWAGFDTLVTNALHFEEAGIDLPDPVGHETSMDTIARMGPCAPRRGPGPLRAGRVPQRGQHGGAVPGLRGLPHQRGRHPVHADGQRRVAGGPCAWAYKLTVEDQVLLPSPDDIGGSFGAALLAGKLAMNWCGSLCVRNFDRDIEDTDVAMASQILFPTREDGPLSQPDSRRDLEHPGRHPASQRVLQVPDAHHEHRRQLRLQRRCRGTGRWCARTWWTS